MTHYTSRFSLIVEGCSMGEIKLGISSCLLGNNVRYDGGHKFDHILCSALGKDIEYVPVCPEVECGLGIPREVMRLAGKAASPRLVTIRSRQDKTDILTSWAQKRIGELEAEDLCGFIFKSGSPSCGIRLVNVYNQMDLPVQTAAGIFSRLFMEHFPGLPAEDEICLHDPEQREKFLERIRLGALSDMKNVPVAG